MTALIREQVEWSDNWWNNADNTTLPRVLLTGASNCRGYSFAVFRLLADVANVDRLSNSRGPTDPIMLKELDLVLADRPYAVVHVQNGTHARHLSASDYEAGMQHYVDEIRRLNPSAKVICATSTPIMQGGNVKAFDAANAMIVDRNDAIVRVAKRSGCEINDVYPMMLNRPECFADDGIHFNETGYNELAAAVASIVRRHLPA